jgi:hypothetical protein
MEKVAHQFTDCQRREIIAKLKNLAVAQAEFWDTLRDIELEHNITIETDIYLTGEIAGNCEQPASHLDLDDGDVWASFEEHSSVESDTEAL